MFAYGSAAYVLFLATFLYLIGFIGGIVVPKSVDSGAATPLGQAIAINIVLVGLFGVQHSVMARPGFKRWWTRIIPEPVERSTFVLLTCVVFGIMFWQWRPIAGIIWEVEGLPGRVILWALFATGMGIVLLTTFLIDHFDLFGLRQVYLHATGKPYTQPRFQVSSFYKYVRHPLLLGFLIAMWSTPRMTVGHLVLALGFTAYILIGIRFEERDLARDHGEIYADYRRRVPMLLPFKGNGAGQAFPAEGPRETPETPVDRATTGAPLGHS